MSNPFEVNDVDPAEFTPQFQLIPSGKNNFIVQQATSGRRVGLSFAAPIDSLKEREKVVEKKKGWTLPQVLMFLIVILIVCFCSWMYYNHSINEIKKDIVFCRNNADTQDKRIKAMYYDTCPQYEEYMDVDSPLWYIFLSLRWAVALSFVNNIGYFLSENLMGVGLFLMALTAFISTISDQISKILSPFIQKRKKE